MHRAKIITLILIVGLSNSYRIINAVATAAEWTQLVRAIERGDLATVKTLVPSKIKAHEKTRGGHSIYDIAKYHNQSAIMAYFNEPTADDWNDLIHAIKTGDLRTVQRIVPRKIKPHDLTRGGHSVLWVAEHNRQPAIVAYLNPSGASGSSSGSSSRGQILFYVKGAPYYEFTNFYDAPITLDGKVWPTTEHYFQAQKFPHVKALQEKIRNAPTPRAAFDTARKYNHLKIKNWDIIKDDAMRRALQAKFTQHPRLYSLLKNTGNQELVEDSPVDSYWGWGKDRTGKNMLGKLLMELRATL